MKQEEYDKLAENYKDLGLVLPQNIFEYIKEVDQKTQKGLGKLWKKNIKYNLKHNLPKHGWINDGYANIGVNKAIIGIGAGPSLKRNWDMLKMVSLGDGTRPWEEQDYIMMASNHQVKPCFENGIIPHFAMVADASQELAKQMKVGSTGKHTALIATIQTHPDVIDAWPGPVKFTITKSGDIIEEVEKQTGEKFNWGRAITGGGNVLNLSFLIGVGLFRSSVWMCLGNDLSFPIIEDIEEKRKAYYADGDYSTNMASKRDEARREFSWYGFEYPLDTVLLTNAGYINFKLVHTAPQLFVYKSWLEATAAMAWRQGSKFTLYNCSEQGILGVCLKETAQDVDKYEEKFDQNNWLMMDEICPNKWRTYKFENAVEEFYNAKNYLLYGTPKIVRSIH